MKAFTQRQQKMLRQLFMLATGVYKEKGPAALLDWCLWLCQLRRYRLQHTFQSWLVRMEPNASPALRVAQTVTPAPRLSFVTPVYNTPADVLRQTLDSVIAQTDKRWELCAADASDEGSDASVVLAEYAQKDCRIRVLRLKNNQGISSNSNQSAHMAQGDYLALLDHDDLLAPNMVAEVCSLLDKHSEADIVYFDEDKITGEGGERHEPWFKPHQWSPDLLISANFLMHSVVRRRLAVTVGLFDSAADGAQDWDLMLRCSELTRAIYHIPKILYHWRQVAGSTAADGANKPWVFASQRYGITAHLQRQGLMYPSVEFHADGIRAYWSTSPAKVSIIITTGAAPCLLRQCLLSLQRQTRALNTEVLVVNNGSRDARCTQTILERVGFSCLIQSERSSEAAARNQGARQAHGEFLVFLHDDIEAENSAWLDEMMRWAQRPGVGAVGAKLLFSNRRIQHAGLLLGAFGYQYIFQGAYDGYTGIFGSTGWYRNYQAVSGACLMVHRRTFLEAGGFDEHWEQAHREDESSTIDLCLRLQALGLRIVYTPFAALRHHVCKQPTLTSGTGEGDNLFGHPSLLFDAPIPQLPKSVIVPL